VSPRDSDVRIVKVGSLGPFENNAYVIIDRESNESIIVDAPFEGEKVLKAARRTKVKAIVLTHRHPDHAVSIDLLKERTDAPLYCHEADREPHADKVDGTLDDGQELTVGRTRVRVIHTPGHTPGSICLLVGRHLIAGDTLFPGGPGHTDKPEDLEQEIRSILDRLYPLPDDTRVYTGHGDDTTIGRSKKEYAVFASREHPADLCGDVLWESS
jgi:hydroxyacylglutathione hydrolase